MKLVVLASAGMDTEGVRSTASSPSTNSLFLGRPSQGRTTNWRLLTFALLIAFAAAPAAAHPFHVSYAEVDWNPKTGKFEVALKIDPDDLERAVRLHCRKRINIDHKSSAPLIASYICDNFAIREPRKNRPTSATRVTSPANNQKAFKWVGSEIDTKQAWLFFELAIKREPDGMVIENTLLANTHHPANTVLIRADKKKVTLTFNNQKTKHAIRIKSKTRTAE